MSEKQKLGQEPAFPCNVHYTEEGRSGVANPDGSYGEIGMSKRFYAACAAIQGLYSMASNPDMYRAFEKWAKSEKCNTISEYIVKQSYIAADELLKQENQ